MTYVWATIDDSGAIDERTVRTSRDQAIAAFLIDHRTDEPIHAAWTNWEKRGHRCERFRLVAAPLPAQPPRIIHGLQNLPVAHVARTAGSDAVRPTS